MPRSSSSSSGSGSGSSRSSVRRRTRNLPDTVPVNAMIYFCCQNPKKVKAVRAYYYDDDFETRSNGSHDSLWSWGSSGSNVSYGFVYRSYWGDGYEEEEPRGPKITMQQQGRPGPGAGPGVHPGMMGRPPQHFQQPPLGGGGQPLFPHQAHFQQQPGPPPPHPGWGNRGVTVVDDMSDDDDSGSEGSSDDGSGEDHGRPGHPGAAGGPGYFVPGQGPAPGQMPMPMPMPMPPQGPPTRMMPPVTPHPHMTGATQMSNLPRSMPGLPRMAPVPPNVGFSPAGRMGPPPPPGPQGGPFVRNPNGVRAFMG
ncbi:hypothetical protein QBC44DRAFT_366224 [Cladorrhinum sp. PSN332]|nr:hypothetical protein QBC44DRAFT_366224 [Cladorrhinum sp. PSN332]